MTTMYEGLNLNNSAKLEFGPSHGTDAIFDPAVAFAAIGSAANK